MGNHPIEISPRRSVAVSAGLAILMVVLSYVVLLAVAFACVYLPFLLINQAKSMHGQLVLLLFAGLLIGGTIAWSILPRRDKSQVQGMLLERATHPRLFAELEQIATSLNEAMPRQVYLIGQVNAFVADRGGIMGMGSYRVMGIGLPLLGTLSVSELRAVLAHEFAHYYGGDTRLGPWVYRAQSMIIRTFQNIGKIGGFGRVLAFQLLYRAVVFVLESYFKVFLRVINFVSRTQEFRADELACIVAGTPSLMTGLQKIHGASVAWPTYWNLEVGPIIDHGFIPPIGKGFGTFQTAPAVARQVKRALEEEIEHGTAEPYDTHPPLRERLIAIQRLVVSSTEPDPNSAISLLTAPEFVEASFLKSVAPDYAGLQPINWEHAPEMVVIPGWRTMVLANSQMLDGQTIDSLPELVKRIPELGSRLPDPPGMLLTPEQRIQRVGQILTIALGLSLAERGWKLDSEPGHRNLTRDGVVLDVWTVMDELTSGRLSADAWFAKCKEIGISSILLVPSSRAVSLAVETSQQ